MVNGALSKLVVNPFTGDTVPIFDSNDTEFYALPEMDNSSEMIHEINMTIRAEEHEIGLQRNLNLLSNKCGLGNDRYIFDRDGVRTATEVISEKSDLFQNLKKNELVFESALFDIVKAILEIGGISAEDDEIKIMFDDSIIDDSTQKRTRMLQLVNSGYFPKKRYLKEFEGYSDEDIQNIKQELVDESEPALFNEDGGGS